MRYFSFVIVGTYPLNSILNFLEQFCHPLSNELDHCALWNLRVEKRRALKRSDLITRAQ